MRHGASGMWQSTSINISFVPSNVYCMKKIIFHNSHLYGFLSGIKKTESNINAKYVNLCNTILVWHYILIQDIHNE